MKFIAGIVNIMSLIKEIWYALIPLKLRNLINKKRDDIKLGGLKNKILKYYSTIPYKFISAEEMQVIEYLKNNRLQYFPYNFADKYSVESIKPQYDNNKELFFVLFNNEKLFFKKEWSVDYIKQYVVSLLVEQDQQSPHRYLTEEFNLNGMKILVDVGAAEGNFSLLNIEKFDKVYLFEADNTWNKPLEATFEKWKDKVVIINKFVSNVTNEKCIMLDNYTSELQNNIFIKVDVEGAESKIIEGANKLLSKVQNIKMAFCTYHKQDDEKILTAILNNLNFKVKHSNNYMIFYDDPNQKPPYLRRGLIRCEKN